MLARRRHPAVLSRPGLLRLDAAGRPRGCDVHGRGLPAQCQSAGTGAAVAHLQGRRDRGHAASLREPHLRRRRRDGLAVRVLLEACRVTQAEPSHARPGRRGHRVPRIGRAARRMGACVARRERPGRRRDRHELPRADPVPVRGDVRRQSARSARELECIPGRRFARQRDRGLRHRRENPRRLPPGMPRAGPRPPGCRRRARRLRRDVRIGRHGQLGPAAGIAGDARARRPRFERCHLRPGAGRGGLRDPLVRRARRPRGVVRRRGPALHQWTGAGCGAAAANGQGLERLATAQGRGAACLQRP